MNIIFGPIPSRRFGMSLGVDLSPSIKQCNFDCLYCELQKAKTVAIRHNDSIIVAADTLVYYDGKGQGWDFAIINFR